MKAKSIDLYVFIDALGWDIIQEHPFCESFLSVRYKVKTQFGYSAGALPTILTGKTPAEHGHFSFYYYDEEHSPFKFFKYIPKWKFLNWLLNRHKIRHRLSICLKKILGFTGYFQLYRVPFDHLPYLNYSEKKDIFIEEGLSPVTNLADAWKNKKKHISNWRKTSTQNIQIMKEKIISQSIECGFLYTAELDGFLHEKIKNSASIREKLASYEVCLHELYTIAQEHYNDVNFCIISDHGMTPFKEVCDIKKTLDKYEWGKDYISVMDSTMARFYWCNLGKKDEIFSHIEKLKKGHFLTPQEQDEFGINFPHAQYGQSIYLLDPGYQIIPSDMGLKPLAGMHGYSPQASSSDACFLSNQTPPIHPKWIGDFYTIMTQPKKDSHENT